MSSEIYYNDSSQHGSGQYITLENIVNSYMMGRVSDDWTALEPRFNILYQTIENYPKLVFGCGDHRIIV